MKKIAFILMFIISVSYVSAQDFFLVAGANFSTVRDQNGSPDSSTEYDNITGYSLGFRSDFKIADSIFSFETGLEYAKKGFISTGQRIIENVKYNVKNTVNLNYIHLPVYLKISGKIKENSSINFLFGGYMAMGISGTIDTESENDGNTETNLQTVNWNANNASGITRFDYGGGVGVGFRFNNITIGAGFNLGLQNLSTVNRDQIDPKLRVISCHIGLHL